MIFTASRNDYVSNLARTSAVTSCSNELSDFIHHREGRYCSCTSRARITTAVNSFMVGTNPKTRQNAV
ncbi:Uncharacterized protein HZ326_22755 [Fusarium oxysporum f. sp. albedinis]|nr:Uncharacterized protein HZ326_22755 [Fusarium oxysporum f. sp. albedinis]